MGHPIAKIDLSDRGMLSVCLGCGTHYSRVCFRCNSCESDRIVSRKEISDLLQSSIERGAERDLASTVLVPLSAIPDAVPLPAVRAGLLAGGFPFVLVDPEGNLLPPSADGMSQIFVMQQNLSPVQEQLAQWVSGGERTDLPSREFELLEIPGSAAGMIQARLDDAGVPCIVRGPISAFGVLGPSVELQVNVADLPVVKRILEGEPTARDDAPVGVSPAVPGTEVRTRGSLEQRIEDLEQKLDALARGTQSLVLRDASGVERLQLAVDDAGPALSFLDQQGRIRLRVGMVMDEFPSVDLYDAEGEGHVQLSVHENSPEVSVTSNEPQGAPCASLVAEGLEITDENGCCRVSVVSPGLAIMDANGRPRVSVGSTEIPEGEEVRVTDISSLELLGEDGRVIWQATD